MTDPTMKPQPDRIASLFDRAKRDIDDGVLPACQIAIAQGGEVVASATFGDATDDTRFIMWSCTKAITGAAVWMVMGEGGLDPTAKVGEYIPEFATNGKEVITVEQLLLHTAGIPYAPIGARQQRTSEGRREAFAGWGLNWEPGSRFEYHPMSAHWVLAELVQTVTRSDYREFIKARINEPLKLSRLQLGVPQEEQGDIADMVLVGTPATTEEFEAAGLPAPTAPAAAVAVDSFALTMNHPKSRAVGIPAGGAVSTAADLALFYQALLHNPGELWAPAVLADGTGTVRNSFPDRNNGDIPVNRTRGLVVAGGDGNAWRRVNFGKTCGPRTFGHDGAFGQLAWADPDTGISFAYLTNGLDRNNVRGGRRGLDLSGGAGLVTTPASEN